MTSIDSTSAIRVDITLPIFPKDIDLDRAAALTITWSDGRVSVYPVGYLRRHSPAADARQEREEQQKNPLAVLKTPSKGADGPFRAESVELVGHYALRVRFSDGHETGLYTWGYLREIDPGQDEAGDHPL